MTNHTLPTPSSATGNSTTLESGPERPSPVRTLIITASTRTGRFGPVPAAWAAEQAHRRADLDVETVDLAQASLPAVLGEVDARGRPPSAVTEFGRRLDRAEAVVIVTPVYNRGYPASLKNAIDSFYDEWARTPVGFVSYGGRTGGIEAVEQLRPVFTELRTMTIQPVLSFPDYWDSIDPDGDLAPPDSTALAADRFFDELVWWSLAMRVARAEVPA
ncbi:NAD(P)H-dependent FMN reductase [Dietzia sp. 2505]|uniref:NADPH-dependent FMN reductase n=1 Tax=Dietzia sp. 2505 TaxID=3156457 RepID=UPI003392D29A